MVSGRWQEIKKYVFLLHLTIQRDETIYPKHI